MNNESEEIWKPIPTYEGYEASNLGRIRSWRNGFRHPKLTKPRIMIGSYNNKGYRRVIICLGSGKQLYRQVNVLIATTFLGSRPEGLVICHKNGNPKDDRAENLEYKTQRENLNDRWKHGTMRLGEAINTTKLTNEQVIEIYTSDIPTLDLVKKFNISRCPIDCIRSDKTWKHITKTLIKPKYKKTERVLTLEMVIEIYTSNIPTLILAEKFGTKRSVIDSVRNGDSWRDVTQDLEKGDYQSLYFYNKKVDGPP